MTTRLAPWQRNVIALARGILLRPSGKMKWIANIRVLAAKGSEREDWGVYPIEADSEIDAARSGAMSVAKALYGAEAQVGFVNPTDPPLYMATVGLYQGEGVTKGKSLSVLVREYNGK